jgi:hypothetical protein
MLSGKLLSAVCITMRGTGCHLFNTDVGVQGEIIRCDGYSFHVEYDDGECEWLLLLEESFKWLTPRGASTGGGDEKLIEAMCNLQAENMLEETPAPSGVPPVSARTPVAPVPAAYPLTAAGGLAAGPSACLASPSLLSPESPASGLDAVGRRICLRCPGGFP